MNTYNIKLPPLPEPDQYIWYSRSLVEQIIKEAIEVDRQRITTLNRQQIIDRFDFLEGVVTESHFRRIYETAIEIAAMSDRKRSGEPVAWTLTQQEVIALAEELIVGASTMGGMDDDGAECDVRLMVRMPGTIADDDGKLNDKPILAFCLDDYPEEGVYPIDPAECRPQADPQPAEPVKVPSDDDLVELRSGFDWREHYGNIGFARALLASYGAQPAASAEPVGTVCWRGSPYPSPSVDWIGRPPEDGTPVYATAVAAQPSVPEGWKLVPVDLTEDMHRAAVRAAIKCSGNDDLPPQVYAAMLAAAPAPPAAEQPPKEPL